MVAETKGIFLKMGESGWFWKYLGCQTSGMYRLHGYRGIRERGVKNDSKAWLGNIRNENTIFCSWECWGKNWNGGM